MQQMELLVTRTAAYSITTVLGWGYFLSYLWHFPPVGLSQPHRLKAGRQKAAD